MPPSPLVVRARSSGISWLQSTEAGAKSIEATGQAAQLTKAAMTQGLSMGFGAINTMFQSTSPRDGLGQEMGQSSAGAPGGAEGAGMSMGMGMGLSLIHI